MQYAASIKYGGLLVNASEYDYEAFRNLGLTCPHCHDSVFLVQGHERHYQKTSKVTVEDGIQIDPTIDFDNQPGIIYQVTVTKQRDITGSFKDLHESVKKRWQSLSDYRPENLRKFQADLAAYK